MAAADRRAAILDAARSAFADRGYHETSLDSVAERAGVSKALLYEHFGSKRELYVAMLEMHVHELVERISGAVAGAIVQLMSEEAERKGLDFPKLPQFVEMIAQQMVGAMQSLADWWDLHRKVPKKEVVQAAMDFAWIGQERISGGERWARPRYD